MTAALQTLSLVAYRGITDLTLENLTPISLVVGDNNTGKSSILEAAALVLRPPDPGQWVQVARHRDIDMALVDGLWALFPGGAALQLEDGPQQSKPMKLAARLAGKERSVSAQCLASQSWDVDEGGDVMLRVEIEIDGQGPQTMEFRKWAPTAWAQRTTVFRVFTVTPATHRSTRTLIEHLSRVVDEGKKQLAIHLLQVFDPAVEDLEVSSSLGRDAIRVTHGARGVVDLSSFGDGMRRAAALALAVTRAAHGVVLIDEIEAGIHHTVLPRVLSSLFAAAAESQAQILATTHSLEAVDAIITAVEELGAHEILSAHYARRVDGQPDIRRYDHGKLRRLRDQGLDIR
jgi:predicted ATPase